MEYFPHYVTASTSRKINVLRDEFGSEAIDLYWMLLEMMYEEEKGLDLTENSSTISILSTCLKIEKSRINEMVLAMLDFAILLDILPNFARKNVIAPEVLETVKKLTDVKEKRRQAGRLGGLAKANSSKKQMLSKSSNKTKTKTKTKKDISVRFTTSNEVCENHDGEPTHFLQSPGGVLYCPICDADILASSSSGGDISALVDNTLAQTTGAKS